MDIFADAKIFLITCDQNFKALDNATTEYSI